MPLTFLLRRPLTKANDISPLYSRTIAKTPWPTLYWDNARLQPDTECEALLQSCRPGRWLQFPGRSRMMRIRIMIDELSRRAEEKDLISLLATSRSARLYNADLARELRDVVGVLRKELEGQPSRAPPDPCATSRADRTAH